jgi:hypothetical protein
LDFTYLARRDAHDEETLRAMTEAHARFCQNRVVFEQAGVRGDGFSLPRQHALIHYVASIREFGSPNGLCSSITESKHIDAVKKPWRRSGRNGYALKSILDINTRLRKLTAARVEFGRRGMLSRTLEQDAQRTAAARAQGVPEDDFDPRDFSDDEEDSEDDYDEGDERAHLHDVGRAHDARAFDYRVTLSTRPGECLCVHAYTI